jgi:L,D-transpeptidase catalytic domain
MSKFLGIACSIALALAVADVGTGKAPADGISVSSGCIRLTNEDVIDLYGRTPTGTKVIVLATATPAFGEALISDPSLRIR